MQDSDFASRFNATQLTYLDTASYGLPPIATLDAMRKALDAWSAGTARCYSISYPARRCAS